MDRTSREVVVRPRFIRSPCTEVRELAGGPARLWRAGEEEKKKNSKKEKVYRSSVGQGETKGKKESVSHMDLSSNVVRK